MIVKQSHFNGDGSPVEVVEVCFCDSCAKRIEAQDTLCKVDNKHYCLFCYEKLKGVDYE